MDLLKVYQTELKGAFLIQPFYSEDKRGYLLKDYEKNSLKQQGLDFEISESFESFSKKNTIRGLHFQIKQPQAKLVRVLSGDILDVIVDLRINVDTFGKWKSFKLSAENRKILYVPRGFAHGFQVLSESAVVSYKCDGKYDKGSDTGIRWNDSQLGVQWMEEGQPIISQRDQNLMSFEEFKLKFRGL